MKKLTDFLQIWPEYNFWDDHADFELKVIQLDPSNEISYVMDVNDLQGSSRTLNEETVVILKFSKTDNLYDHKRCSFLSGHRTVFPTISNNDIISNIA